eukprot:scaffold2654_cov126-Cylindrotheca_fusiformis.AAC.3
MEGFGSTPLPQPEEEGILRRISRSISFKEGKESAEAAAAAAVATSSSSSTLEEDKDEKQEEEAAEQDEDSDAFNIDDLVNQIVEQNDEGFSDRWSQVQKESAIKPKQPDNLFSRWSRTWSSAVYKENMDKVLEEEDLEDDEEKTTESDNNNNDAMGSEDDDEKVKNKDEEAAPSDENQQPPPLFQLGGLRFPVPQVSAKVGGSETTTTEQGGEGFLGGILGRRLSVSSAPPGLNTGEDTTTSGANKEESEEAVEPSPLSEAESPEPFFRRVQRTWSSSTKEQQRKVDNQQRAEDKTAQDNDSGVPSEIRTGTSENGDSTAKGEDTETAKEDTLPEAESPEPFFRRVQRSWSLSTREQGTQGGENKKSEGVDSGVPSEIQTSKVEDKAMDDTENEKTLQKESDVEPSTQQTIEMAGNNSSVAEPIHEQ